MLRRFISFAFALFAVMGAPAQPQPLKFGPDGRFKIVQFTDIHYKTGNSASKEAVSNIAAVLDAEKPDLVVITGDLVFAKGVRNALDSIAAPIVARNIPFATAFGNHDEQFDMTPSAMYDMLRSMPGSVMPERGDVERRDYVVEVMASDGSCPAAVLYCIDSHGEAQDSSIGGYAWITDSQIDWYRQQSKRYAQANGGKPLPALAFFHIPVPEFDYAVADGKHVMKGKKGEAVCCPKINTGLFAAMRQGGDVSGIFCGHDHDNDYAVEYFDILLAYGRYTGANTVYNHLHPKGGRVIELKEGSREFDTWIRLVDGTMTQKSSFPADFRKK